MRKIPDVTPKLESRGGLRWIIFAVAILISGGSIIYTNFLVDQIKEREQKQIELYASSIEYLASENENPILILNEIVVSNNTIPVILTNANRLPEQYRNLPVADDLSVPKRKKYLEDQLEIMADQHQPIEVTLRASGEEYGKKYIYYKNSRLLTQLAYYPYIQLSIITIFVVLLFYLFNYFRRLEQNRVWVGLAKETAHQLGTPLSSLMAWSEYFKQTNPEQMDMLTEFDKDIERLEVITERFSNIGSVPNLQEENITEVVEDIGSYLGKRLSTKITLTVRSFPSREIRAHINKSLFAWVIENLCKNAADAMEGKGDITIKVIKINEGIAIDVSDTGKGMSKSRMKQVFQAGFTTKKRGWGLGLTLAQRIIENYHKGKIFVKRSELNVGTTFRIFLQS